ncbi:AraC family transcriptional regulator [Ensifer sp. Root142]|uniref:helix-turn-helix transcriptional regulator n=1 Tax=Ensifer sp. Root142 TaxID=1736461 RepID=UPI000AC646E5|nr:AraC family transcriptional regulator [Ensifer sp. Root142]
MTTSVCRYGNGLKPDAEGEVQADESRTRRHLRVRDLLRQDGIVLESPDGLSPDDTLMRGEFLHRELRRGLVLHVSDAIEERPFTATSRRGEELSCIFFLDGNVDLSIGDRHFHFDAHGGVVQGVAIMNASPESFSRASLGGQHLRHLVVSATPEWLHLDALDEVADTKGGERLLREHLFEHRWTVTPRLIEIVRQIFAPPPLLPAMRDLYLESRAVELVAETMAAALQASRREPTGMILTRQDAICLDRAKNYVAARWADPLNVEVISRAAGISASGLQRLFRIAENQSVFEYVRKLRLAQAFAALSNGEATVLEASVVAGYSSAANFATAFRRQFGITPSHLMRRSESRHWPKSSQAV